MTRRATVCTSIGVIILSHTCLGADPLPAPAPTSPSTQPAKPAGPRVVTLTIGAGTMPDPALKYLLLPDYVDQTPGNAESLLYMAAHVAGTGKGQDFEKMYDQIGNWVDLPLDKLPREEVLKTLDRLSGALHYVQIACRREYCEWDLPARTEGIDLLLPSLRTHRLFSKALALRIRLAVADKRYDDAIADLKTGFALARYTGTGTTIIHPLVGAAIESLMARELEHWIGQPGSPNLYWTLVALPRPFIDARRGFEFERMWMLVDIPHLQELRTAALTPPQVDAMLSRIVKLAEVGEGGKHRIEGWDSADAAARTIKAAYPAARKALIDNGYSEDRVKAMLPPQVVLLHDFTQLVRVRDEYFKWFALPYAQARHGIEQGDRLFEQMRQGTGSRNPFLALTPSLARAHYSLARIDRDIAALQCLEAIRLYVATHQSKLPPALEAVQEVPVPLDPVTGKPFVYEASGNTARLICVTPYPSELQNETRYELTGR